MAWCQQVPESDALYIYIPGPQCTVIILGMVSANVNERWHYKVTSSLIGWSLTLQEWYMVAVSGFSRGTINRKYMMCLSSRGVTIRLATIRYISRYTTHDMVHDTIQNQLIYYQWKIWKHCGMCHQYFYIKTVILARNSEFEINKDVHNHPCPKYLLLTNCVCKQNNKIS